MPGSFQVIAGLAGIFENEFHVQTPNYFLEFDASAWGWIHLIWGVLVLIEGFGLLAGSLWGRTLGVFAAAISAIANFAFIPLYPVWSIAVIVLDVAVTTSVVRLIAGRGDREALEAPSGRGDLRQGVRASQGECCRTGGGRIRPGERRLLAVALQEALCPAASVWMPSTSGSSSSASTMRRRSQVQLTRNRCLSSIRSCHMASRRVRPSGSSPILMAPRSSEKRTTSR